MKKVTLSLSTVIALIASFAFVRISTFKHPKPEVPSCYTWSKDGKSCSGSALNCTCNQRVSQDNVSALNSAIASNTITSFFSNSDNITAFALNQTEVQELTTVGCWIVTYFNQGQGVFYYAVGLSTSGASFDNADFILNITPTTN